MEQTILREMALQDLTECPSGSLMDVDGYEGSCLWLFGSTHLFHGLIPRVMRCLCFINLVILDMDC